LKAVNKTRQKRGQSVENSKKKTLNICGK